MLFCAERIFWFLIVKNKFLLFSFQKKWSIVNLYLTTLVKWFLVMKHEIFQVFIWKENCKMSSVSLKNVKKIYPRVDSSKKRRAKKDDSYSDSKPNLWRSDANCIISNKNALTKFRQSIFFNRFVWVFEAIYVRL